MTFLRYRPSFFARPLLLPVAAMLLRHLNTCFSFQTFQSGSVPAESDLGSTIVGFAVFGGFYAALFLWWIRRNRRVRAC